MLVGAQPAHAYEFEVRAQSVGQANTLYALRLNGAHTRFARRRVSQSLQLHLWDLSGKRRGLSSFRVEEPSGPSFFLTSYLRLHHDFGSFSNEQLLIDGRLADAIDVVPELQNNLLEFDLLFGYAGAEGLLDGRIDLYLGRQMEIQTLDWFSMDGLKARAHLPAHIAIEGFGGLRVQESSLVGYGSMAPDGTSGALCEEYVEGAQPGSGAWRPIDGLPLRSRGPFSSDDEYCPQRDELMPTWGAAIATEGLKNFVGRLSYRRSQSKTTGLLGDANRLAFEDLGLYPNENGQAPSWGVNEERIALSMRMPMRLKSKLAIVPYVAARYSLLHGLLDEAHGGVRVAKFGHSLESELFYSVPTFDGDSIFNIFSSEPYSDARSTWSFRPDPLGWGTYSRLWGRRYHSEDNASVSGGSANDYAGGLQLGSDYRLARDRILRVDLFHEDGYGGQRSGGYVSAHWQWRSTTLFRGRVSVVHFDEDLRTNLRATNFGSQLGTTYLFNKGVAASLLLEQNSSEIDRFQLALFAMFDLAFQPET
jgi:hypothetical protein